MNQSGNLMMPTAELESPASMRDCGELPCTCRQNLPLSIGDDSHRA
jgi:hypothetical protein